MLKAKTGNNVHKSRTLSDAIDDVKKTEMAQINVILPKDLRKKFKRKAEDNDSNMIKVLTEYISKYVQQ